MTGEPLRHARCRSGLAQGSTAPFSRPGALARSVLTIGCSGAFAPAGYSPLPEGSPVLAPASSGTFARSASEAICEVSATGKPRHHRSVIAIVNARVWTNDPRRPWADALLVDGASIVAIGSSAELRKRAGRDARLIDARGLLVCPTGAGRSLAPGGPASLVVVEGATDDPAAPGGRVVLEIVDGEVRTDRGDLAG